MKQVRGLALMLLLPGLALVACDDPAGVEQEFDPASTAEAMAAMAETTEALQPAFAGMAAASVMFEGSFMGLAMAEGPAVEGEALRTLAAGPEVPDGMAASVIPSEYYGTTFQWDTETGMYAPTEVAGAPEDGVRIVYYAVDPMTSMPVTPLNALGYVEIRDLSTMMQNELAIVVVSEAGDSPVTLADYSQTMSFTATQSSFSADMGSAGYFSDGTDQLNFDFATSMAMSEAGIDMAQDYSMSLEGTGMGVSFVSTLSADPQTETGTAEVLATITNGSEEVVLEMTFGEAGQLDGEIRYQGVVVVQVSGSGDEPVFTDQAGNELTEEDLDELAELWSSIDVLFGVAEGAMSFGPSFEM